MDPSRTHNMATEDTISQIAKALGEVEETPLSQIEGVVVALGEEVALQLLDETLEIEKGEGMPLADGSRRRSPGGVFFQLARRKLSPEDKRNIFRDKKSGEPASQNQPATVPDSTKFPRRRVVEVVPPRAQAKGKAGFVPPELPSALTRARIRQQVTQAVAPLPIEEQYHLLLDLLADIHDRVAGPTEKDAAARGARGVRRK